MRFSRARNKAGANRVFVHLINALVVRNVLISHIWSKAIPRPKIIALMYYV